MNKEKAEKSSNMSSQIYQEKFYKEEDDPVNFSAQFYLFNFI